MSFLVASDPSGREIMAFRSASACSAILAPLSIAIASICFGADRAAASDATVIVSPDLECRVLLPLEKVRAPHFLGGRDGLDLEYAQMLSGAWLEIELEERRVPRPLEIEAFLVVSPWDPDSVSWESPWEIPGGDFFISPQRETRERDLALIEVLHPDEPRETLKFDVMVPMVAAWSEGYVVHGFALSMPWEDGMGFSPADLDILGPVSKAWLDIQLGPMEGFYPPPPPPPFEPPLHPQAVGQSKVKSKDQSLPPTKPVKDVVKSPPPPPPPPPVHTPDGEVSEKDRKPNLGVSPAEDSKPKPAEKPAEDSKPKPGEKPAEKSETSPRGASAD
jgi:hypothetical protein